MSINLDQIPFRGISLAEYQRRHDDTANRITTADLESGMIVEAFSTNQFLREQGQAVTFTAELGLVQKHRAHDMGRSGFKLAVLSGVMVARLDIERFANGYPEDAYRDAPLVWTASNTLHLPKFSSISQGFFSR